MIAPWERWIMVPAVATKLNLFWYLVPDWMAIARDT
jgi:hypothetical protein